ncbi:hypothetical protein ACIPSA_35040 [Streptomyces sp. NPDC086549]|uniref:hypothetical protein n=1 Tax=Streptomyces sp. NPDC086549 TaxID=3365752 RepID=UPI0038243CB5
MVARLDGQGPTLRAPGADRHGHTGNGQLGGDPTDARHLWVEPPDSGHGTGGGVNNKKDPVETKPRTGVCSGGVALAAARRAIVTDWAAALSGSVGLG